MIGELTTQSSQRDLHTRAVFAATLIFLTIFGIRLVRQYVNSNPFIEDDAYYYTIIAQNIAHGAASTFDGQTLTNGYHPLWLLVLVAQDLIFGSSYYITLLIEYFLVAAGLWFFLESFRSNSVILRLGFAAIYTFLAWIIAVRGMETSLLLFAFGLFTKLIVANREGENNLLALSLTAILSIGARLDAVFFVLPILLLTVASLRGRLLALTLIGAAGSIYISLNIYLFGTAFPVSGAVKSLGGLQVNEALFDSIAQFWRNPNPLKQLARFSMSAYCTPLLMFAATGMCFFLSRRTNKSWPLAAGYLIGFVLFCVKQVAFSSWTLWPWYGYPAIIGLCALFHIGDDEIGTDRLRINLRVVIPALALTLSGFVLFILRYDVTRVAGFPAVNLEAAREFSNVFKGERVAMGDRSGSFAASYSGPLTQLEGLVNDKTYLEALQHHEDIKPLLCARGVHYVLAYQRDLGAYENVSIPVLRHFLTHFPSPALEFSKADEIGRVADLAKYDNSSFGEGDNYLYAWRLSGCPAQNAASIKTPSTIHIGRNE